MWMADGLQPHLVSMEPPELSWGALSHGVTFIGKPGRFCHGKGSTATCE